MLQQAKIRLIKKKKTLNTAAANYYYISLFCTNNLVLKLWNTSVKYNSAAQFLNTCIFHDGLHLF